MTSVTTISSVLRELHWFPVDDRIVFKILFITFKTLQGLAPHYLTNLINVYQPPRQLRSSNKNLLVIPPVSYVSYGHSGFFICRSHPMEPTSPLC